MEAVPVLIVDDEKLICWSLKEFLQKKGYIVRVAGSGGVALRALEEDTFGAVLLDYRLPDMAGLDVLKEIRKEQPELPVVMLISQTSVENAVAAVKAGLVDYITKPFRNEDVVLRLERVLETARMQREVEQLRKEQPRRFASIELIGTSLPMQAISRQVDRKLPMQGGAVLIQGESGTGKDLLARALHLGGSWSNGTFLIIACAADGQPSLERSLFGSETDCASTDGRIPQRGALELASGGTLLLEEVTGMDLELQSKLLGFLERRTFRRVGGRRDVSSSATVIATTHRDLERIVEKGGFREDLYLKLAASRIILPPLRERLEDVPHLVEYFIREFNRELRKDVKGVEPGFMDRLVGYSWPGNVRELRNAIERAMILAKGDVLGAGNPRAS